MDSPSRVYNDGVSDVHQLMSSPSSSHEGEFNDAIIVQELRLAEHSVRASSHTALCTEDLNSTAMINLYKDGIRSSRETSDLKVGFDGLSNDDEKFVEEVDLVLLVNEGKPPSYMRSIENIILVKPLDKSKSKPGRIKFKLAQNSIISNSDDLQIFLRDFDKNVPIRGKFTQDSLKNVCSCFNEHQNSTFCVRSNEYKITWTTEGVITAHVEVEDITKFEIFFAPIICESKFKKSDQILELVFQIQGFNQVYQQIYFIKFCASPSRDFKSFVKKLEKRKLVRNSVLQAMEIENVVPAYELVKITYSPDDKDEFLETVRNLGGRFLSVNQD